MDGLEDGTFLFGFRPIVQVRLLLVSRSVRVGKVGSARNGRNVLRRFIHLIR